MATKLQSNQKVSCKHPERFRNYIFMGGFPTGKKVDICADCNWLITERRNG